MTSTGRDQLKAFIERVERLEEEKKALADDIRDVYAEAKGNGFDTRAIRVIIRKRKLDQEERLNQEQLVETYMVALGMGWGKSGDDVDAALDRRRTEAGKAKTERGRQPPRAQACLFDDEDVLQSDIVDEKSSSLAGRQPVSAPSAAASRRARSSGGEARPRPGLPPGVCPGGADQNHTRVSPPPSACSEVERRRAPPDVPTSPSGGAQSSRREPPS